MLNSLSTDKRISNAIILVVFICVCVFILLQSPISPIGNGVPGTDSSIFIYMAETMLEGQPLYIAAWDHKGPLVYIIDALGLLIAPGYVGIWILEVISMVISMVYVYKTIRLELNQSLSLVGTLSLFTLVVAALEGGNFTEEFALPFICFGLYTFMRYFIQKKGSWFISGLCLSAVILLKLNYAFPWLVFIPLVIVDMILNKDRKIVRHALLFLLGMVVVMIPIGIYFVLTHSLQAMIDAAYVYNFTYAGNASFYDIISSCVLLLARVDLAGVHIALTAGSVFVLAQLILHKERHTKKILLIGILLLNILGLYCMSVSGRGYAHYFIPLLVLLVYPAMLLLKALYALMKNKSPKYISAVLIAILVGAWAMPIPFNVGKALRTTNEQSEIDAHYVELIKDNTNPDDTIQVLGMHTSLYLLSGRKACSRFMFFPPYDLIDTEFYQDIIIAEIKEKLSEGIPRVVIVAKEALLPFFTAELDARYLEAEKNVYISK